MVSGTLSSALAAALVCASSASSYVLPGQSSLSTGDIASAQAATHLGSRSLGADLDPSHFSVPIYRRHGGLHPDINKRDPNKTRSWAFKQAELMKTKYGARNTNTQHRKRQTIGLTDVGQDSYYFAQLSIGTPSQNFNVILDTGSSDFWLIDTSCGTANNCDSSLNKYNPSASSTNIASNVPFSVEYGTGAVQGTLAADRVSLAGYTVNNLTFAEANAVAQGTVEYPYSGIMGMAFQSLSSSGATPFWQVLGKQNVLPSNVFTFQLARNIDKISDTDPNVNTIQSPGGVFTLGTIDSNQYSGSITYTSIPNNLQNQQGLGYWTIPLGGITINGQSASIGTNPLAAIDTGTTLIGGPASSVRAFYSQISGAQNAPDMSGYYLFPCSTSLNIQLQFSGQSFSMSSEDFNLGPYPYTTSSTCLGAVFDIDLGSTQAGVPQWIVGDSFLKNVFSVFDGSGRVGFASLKGSQAQTVSVTANAVPSGTAASSGSSATSMSSIGGGLPLPSDTSIASQATATSVVGGGGNLPVPSASSQVVSSNPSLQSGTSSSSTSSSGSSSSAAGSMVPATLWTISIAAVALMASSGLLL